MTDITVNFHGGNPLSAEAHDSVIIHKARIRREILTWIATRGYIGATCDEVEASLGISHQTASARITEAKMVGDLIDTGRRRPTRTGRSAAVYVTPDNANALPYVATGPTSLGGAA